MSISLFTLVLTISFFGSPTESLRNAWAVCPLGDLSGNCVVDLPDLLSFAGQEIMEPSMEILYGQSVRLMVHCTSMASEIMLIVEMIAV